MTEQELIKTAKSAVVEFAQTMQIIDDNYEFTPTGFKNGDTFNEANTNNGSCKLFAFAQLHQLDTQTTLNLFGRFYSEDVLKNPEGDDHQNIRNFMQYAWQGIEFSGTALSKK